MRHTGTERTRSLPGMAARLGRGGFGGQPLALLPSVGMVCRRPFPGLHLVGMVSHRPFPGLYDEAHRDREDSIPTGDGGPAGPRGFGGQPLALLPSVGMACRRPFPGLHLVGMVSHRPFPELSDEAHRDREDSIPTGDGGPAGPRGFGGQPQALLPSVGMACRRHSLGCIW